MKFISAAALFIMSLAGMWIAVYGYELPGVARFIIGILSWCIFVSLMGFFDSAKPSQQE